MTLLTDLFDGLRSIWYDNTTADVILISMQISILICSLGLLYFMLRYKNKRALDIALLLREFSFVLIIGRLTVWAIWEKSNINFTLATYIFLTITCIAVLSFLTKEHIHGKQLEETNTEGKG